MITFLRQKTTSWVAKAFLVVLAVGFAATGMESAFMRSRNDPAVITVGDASVHLSTVQASFRHNIDLYRSQLGQEPDGMLRRMILDQTVEQLARGLAAKQLAGDLGLPVARATLRSEIANTDVFRNPLGQFDPQQFHFMLQRIGMTEDAFLERLAAEEAQRYLRQAVRNNVAAPAPFVDAVTALAGEERNIAFVEVPVEPEKMQPKQGELEKFYSENQGRFMTPERRDVEMLVIDPRQLGKQATIADADVQAFFDKNRASFGTPERRALQQVVFRDEAAAKAAFAKVGGGTPFADLPKALPDAKLEIADLGTVTRDEIPAPLAGAAFKTAAGAVAAPVQSPLGWHLLHVTGVTVGQEPDLAEAKDKIRQQLADQAGYDRAVQLTGEIEDAIFAGATLEAAARDHGLAVTKLEGLATDGTLANGQKAPFAADPKLLLDIRKAALNEPQPFAERPDGTLLAFRVTAIVAPQPRPLAEVREDALKQWQEKTARAAALAKADGIAAAVGTGKAFAEAAKPLAVAESGFVARLRQEGVDAPLPDAVLDRAFTTAPNTPVVVDAGERFYVAMPLAQRPNAALTAAEKALARQTAMDSVKASLADEIDQTLLAAVKARASLEVDSARVNGLLGQ